MKKQYIVILVVIGLTTFFFCMKGWGADWKLLGRNEDYQFYLDTESVTLLPENIVRVWTKSVFTDRGIINVMKRHGTKY
jgi:hypothetical protein